MLKGSDHGVIPNIDEPMSSMGGGICIVRVHRVQ